MNQLICEICEKSDIIKQAIASLSLSCNNFEKCPSDKNSSDIINTVAIIKNTVFPLTAEFGITEYDISEQISAIINSAVMNAWNNKICPDYISDHIHPPVYKLNLLINRVFGCRKLLETVISLSDKSDTKTYEKNLIDITTFEMNAYSDINNNGTWSIEKNLSDENEQSQHSLIAGCHKKIKHS